MRKAQLLLDQPAECEQLGLLPRGSDDFHKDPGQFDPDVAKQIERGLSWRGVEVAAALGASSAIGAAFAPFVNHARLPAISIPCGHDASGLPFGIQIIARRGQDRLLLRAAKRIEYEIASMI